MAQIRQVVSEALQAQIRNLLPSQQGFTEDLQATNVITPVIDLTSAAQGSQSPEYLQRAINYGGANEINVQGAATSTIINNAGFYDIAASSNLVLNNAAVVFVNMSISDGTTDKIVYSFSKNSASSFNEYFGEFITMTVFLRAGDEFKVQTSVGAGLVGSFRQIADVNGNLVNPVGFTPQ